MTKEALRQKVLTQLKSTKPERKRRCDARLTQRFLASSAYQESTNLGLFLSMAFEFDTGEILRQSQADGKSLFIPKTYPEGRMTFMPYEKEQLALSRFGLMEPIGGKAIAKSELDLILVPGLVWNKAGYRIGFGGGYYDRYLADFTGKTVSLCYDFQLLDFENEVHDVAVKEVIDETL